VYFIFICENGVMKPIEIVIRKQRRDEGEQ
jgi:hypothetical protein